VKPREKYVMVNSVKCRREVKENKGRDFLLIRSEEKVILNAK